jgi:hypothetical protein
MEVTCQKALGREHPERIGHLRIQHAQLGRSDRNNETGSGDASRCESGYRY